MNTKCICINSDPNICRAWRYGQSVFFGNTRFPPCDCVCRAAQSDNTQTLHTPSTTQHTPAAELAALRAQRDDLLDAAEQLLWWFDQGRSIAPTWSEVTHLRSVCTAIARTTGQDGKQ